MNFYNPYFYSTPTTSTSTGLLSKLSFGSIINGASKTLNVVNQTIPIVKQMSPMMKNLKTMFSVMNEFKKSEPIPEVSEKKTPELKKINNTDSPTFFI